ncbi:MAG: hypothetical protein MJ211_00640 [Bacteroidales bacterium]|nr:hypothetical protein [Bacteroidales bacterium]
MENNSNYKWKFSKIGGATRVNIETGEDIVHLPELDQKMWNVLSCPSKGLEFDEKTLEILDCDHDGKIRVKDIVETSKWLTSVIKNPDLLINHDSEIRLDCINQDNEEGKRLYNSAKQILDNLQLEKESISISDTSDSIAIFAKTKFNGDGIITENSTDDDNHKKLITYIIDCLGSIQDRSGQPGIDKDKIEQFYTECTNYYTWFTKSETDNLSIYPYGDKTEDALLAYNAIKEKVNDYFVRCKMVAFNKDTYNAMEIQLDKLTQITDENLSQNIEKVANYPLARVSEKIILPINQGINPAWENAFNNIKSLIFDIDFAGKQEISEKEWNSISAKFTPFIEWKNSKVGEIVEKIGVDNIKEIVINNQKDKLLELVEKDLSLKAESDDILSVDKLLHLYRDFHTFLRNFVTFTDFYDRKCQAIFQAGTLYIDQRSCDLCIKVSDMAAHNATAASSGMFLIYCDCESKVKNQKIQIVAALTDGEIDNIMVGKHAIFYDRQGCDWDATITKIIDNPISIRQAFWSPYHKFSNFVKEQITKFASSKDSKITEEAFGKISNAGDKLTEKPADGTTPIDATQPKQQAFDIAKYCGIFAAIGMALGMIGSAIASLISGFLELSPLKMCFAIIGIILLISGPSMLMAWMNLRKRNLSPLLNANGWAINAHTFVNILFGATFTKIAKFPTVGLTDPFAKKKSKLRFLWWGLFILAVVFLILYFNGLLSRLGLPYEGSPIQEFFKYISTPEAPVNAADSTNVAN